MYRIKAGDLVGHIGHNKTNDEKEQIKNTFAEKMLAIEKERLEKKLSVFD
ncbi:hypothetical protein [Gilliamella sp. GillExp13]|nr:hypothetical protein [Gilliamella apicola]